MGKVEDEMHLMFECPLYEALRDIILYMLRARGVAGVEAVNTENMRMMLNGKKLFRIESYCPVYQRVL